MRPCEKKQQKAENTYAENVVREDTVRKKMVPDFEKEIC